MNDLSLASAYSTQIKSAQIQREGNQRGKKEKEKNPTKWLLEAVNYTCLCCRMMKKHWYIWRKKPHVFYWTCSISTQINLYIPDKILDYFNRFFEKLVTSKILCFMECNMYSEFSSVWFSEQLARWQAWVNMPLLQFVWICI